MTEQTLADVDLKALCRRGFHPSPTAWEDQVLYFLLPDRFSDGKETGYRDAAGQMVTTGSTPAYQYPADYGNAIKPEEAAARWREAGGRWLGGKLAGVQSKLGYLRRLGVTAIWLGPVLKQTPFVDSYHGYGAQDFLEVDGHFGTREDLKALVEAAHANGIYVILDIVVNHAGNVFTYDADRYEEWDSQGNRYMDPRWDGRGYPVKGYNDAKGRPTLPFAPMGAQGWPDSGIWPAELQRPDIFTRKGRIRNFDWDPECREGDFFDLKDIDLGPMDPAGYVPTAGLKALCQIYSFWIAYADLDGFRVDTVKHMGDGATRYLTSVIHEFAQSIGKENFYLIGEVAKGRDEAFHTVGRTGLDAALGILEMQQKLESLTKGKCNPAEYFEIFRNTAGMDKGTHAWFRNRLVTMSDDHDKLYQGQRKARYCAFDGGDKMVLSALAFNLMTLGIPCIYYGTEQAFDGQGGSDQYIREAMFGGEFGAFRTRDRHFFNEDHPVYRELSEIIAIRRREPALRRGRQYLLPISGDGEHFGLPTMMGGQIRSVIPWSRRFVDEDILLAINTDVNLATTAWVALDTELHQPGGHLTCLYSTDPTQINTTVPVQARQGSAVLLTVPPAGFAIWK